MAAKLKFWFYENKTNFKEYSVRLIKNLLADRMVASPNDADFVLVSMCDIDEIGDCVKAKAFGKPVISGGMISEYPILNELSDYVWHGEVYEFAEMLDAGMHPDDMPHITTKANRKLRISQKISWEKNPIVKVGKRAMYYYVSKGCPLKCKYCLMGNGRTYQKAPERLYKSVARKCGTRLMPIAAFNPYEIPDGTGIGETLVRKYISGNISGRMIRSGVEFANPELSRNFAKGVGIHHVNEMIGLAKKRNTRLILYFIAGLETQDELEEYFGGIAQDYSTTPSVTIVYTYIDPQPLTPFHDFDINKKIIGIDSRKLYQIAVQRNKRMRFTVLATPVKSTLRTLMGRATTMSDYEAIRKIRNRKFDEIMDFSRDRLSHLTGSAGLDEIKKRPRKGTLPDYWEV